MRLILACVAAWTLLSSPAAAETWYWTGGNEKTQNYVDVDNLRAIGNKIVALTRNIYSEPLCDDSGACDVWAVDIRSEYDCSGGYFRTLEYSYFDIEGSLMSTEASETINEQKVPAKDSLNEAIMEFVCFRRGGEYVANPFEDAYGQF